MPTALTMDPFKTPLFIASSLPPVNEGSPEKHSKQDKQGLGEPISLESSAPRGPPVISRARASASTSQSSDDLIDPELDEQPVQRSRKSDLVGRREDVFFPPQSTPLRRPSPPLSSTFPRTSTTATPFDHSQTPFSRLGSTPYAHLDTATASPADTELRTPRLFSSDSFGFSRSRTIGLRRGRGEEITDDDEEEEDDWEGKQRKGEKEQGGTRPSVGPTPTSQGARKNGVIQSFPFALSTPQNPARRNSSQTINTVGSSTSNPNNPITTASGTPKEPITPAPFALDLHSAIPSSKKRRRTSPEELQVLEEAYEENCLPSSEERARLAGRTGMSTRAVQIWFQNKRQTEKRKQNQRVYPTMMLVPLRQSEVDDPNSQTPSKVQGTSPAVPPSSSYLMRTGADTPGSVTAGKRSPGLLGAYQYVPVVASGDKNGKRPELGTGDEDEGKEEEGDMFFPRARESREEDDEEAAEDRGRKMETIPVSDVRSSSPVLVRSSSPVDMMRERQALLLKRRVSPSRTVTDEEQDKRKKDEENRKRERMMLFPSSKTAPTEENEPLPSPSERTIVLETPASKRITSDRDFANRSTGSFKRTVSEKAGLSNKRTIIGVADLSSGSGKEDQSSIRIFAGRKFAVTRSVPSLSRGDGQYVTFTKPRMPAEKGRYSRTPTATISIRSELPKLDSRSFSRSQSGILDQICIKKELPFLPPSSTKKPGHSSPVQASPSIVEVEVEDESEAPGSVEKKSVFADNSLLDLLPSDPPSMGLVDFHSDAEDAPFEGDTDVEETPKKKRKGSTGKDESDQPILRRFASLDYYAGSPSKRKGLLGDESRRLSGLGSARKRLFEAHLQQQAQQRAAMKKAKRVKKTTTGLTRSGSSSFVSIPLTSVSATPTRTKLTNSRSMPEIKIPSPCKLNVTPGRRVPFINKEGKPVQQTDEEAARLLLGLFGGRS